MWRANEGIVGAALGEWGGWTYLARKAMQIILNAAETDATLTRMAADFRREFSPEAPVNVVGIRTRGDVLANRLVGKLRASGFGAIFTGVLDITLYRDDLSELGPRPLVRPSELPVVIDSRPLVLVDDVLFTGRSIRAALTHLADFGRPSVTRLAVLVDRGGRELPVQADYVGVKVPPPPAGRRVYVRLAETDGADEVAVGPISGRGA
jgi:pyrimidine operon attenuation protein / uracil phosphoribosyltransferase